MNLPETYGRKLPESRQDAIDYGKGQKFYYVPRTPLTKFCMKKKKNYNVEDDSEKEKSHMMA